ncbi:MAG: YdeI/OmpD-associated family protein [Myxococcota bacterium]
MRDRFAHVPLKSRAALRAWLQEHHTQQESIWMVRAKKHLTDQYVPYEEIVQEVLCFGWIDSHVRTLDADHSLLLLSPRRPKSPWSAVNKRHIEALLALGRMTPAGQAKIDAAKADGSWTLYDEVEALVIPPDLQAALAEHSGAADQFEAFSDSSKKGILWWLKSAKRPATRAKRIAETARLAALGIRANTPAARGR